MRQFVTNSAFRYLKHWLLFMYESMVFDAHNVDINYYIIELKSTSTWTLNWTYTFILVQVFLLSHPCMVLFYYRRVWWCSVLHTSQVSRIMRESHTFTFILTVSRMEAFSLTHGNNQSHAWNYEAIGPRIMTHRWIRNMGVGLETLQ